MRTAWALSLLTGVLLTPQVAGSDERLGAGAYIRLSHDCRAREPWAGGMPTDCRTTTGILAYATADSVFLGAPARGVSRTSIARLEVRVRTSRRALTGSIGALVGVVLGTAAGGFAIAQSGKEGPHFPFAAATLGLAIGALAGAAAGGERWRTVPLDALNARE